MDSGPRLRASGSCLAGPRVPLALRLRASYPSKRSVPPPCRPGVAKQARLGRRISPGGSLWVAWVVRVSLSRSTQCYSKPSKSNTYSSECWEAEFREVHTIPIDSLSLFSNSPAILGLFGARRLSQQSHSFFPELRKGAHPRIYGHRGSFIHRSTWKVCSANFVFAPFSEVELPLYGVLGSSAHGRRIDDLKTLTLLKHIPNARGRKYPKGS
jgi:hypothetical protein